MTNRVLEITNLNKSFGAIHATQDLSLTLDTGEIHALIGPNGAGKSTLIKQVTGYLQPDSFVHRPKQFLWSQLFFVDQ